MKRLFRIAYLPKYSPKFNKWYIEKIYYILGFRFTRIIVNSRSEYKAPALFKDKVACIDYIERKR